MRNEGWRAGDLERLTPAQQDEIFVSGIVRDLGGVPEGFLERVRRRLEGHIADNGSSTP